MTLLGETGDTQINVSLQTTTWRSDPSAPIEIGFQVQCDISRSHPKFAEILEFFRTLSDFPSVADAQKILSLLQ